MNAVSPFSLLDRLSPTQVVGSIAGTIAESAKGQNGLAGAFSDAWTGLDANKDGTLNGKDVLGHAVGARNAVLQGIADVFGYDTGPAARALRDGAEQAGDFASATAAAAASAAQQFTSSAAQNITTSAAPAAQMLLASAPPALPSAPAARAVENLPGIAEIRATYAALRSTF
jgi:hypothetical protein